MSKSTLVVGASEKTDRYSNIAIHRLRSAGIPTFAFGNRKGLVLDVPILTDFPKSESIHTVTMYVNAKNISADLQEHIIALSPMRIIFNPGTENPVFEAALTKKGIPFEHACTLVLLSTNRY